MAEKYITRIRTSEGDLQIDYNALANLPSDSNIQTQLDNLKTAVDGKAASSHTQAASTITAGTFKATGVKAATGTDYTTSRIRNIQASTTDLTAGTSELANGDIYFVYE